MRVYRVMSRDEWQDLVLNNEKALMRDSNGRRVRFKWFAVDKAYIASILARKMYRSRSVIEAYQVIVCMDINGYWVRKMELGYVNLGLDTEKPFELNGVCWVKDAQDWFRKEGWRLVRPTMFYWNRKGRVVNIIGTRQFVNIMINGNLYGRPWFVRADKYWVLRGRLDRSDCGDIGRACCVEC